ncbi:glycosyltransferase family 2 protein [Sulfurimonas microaerophilic]|uniref:glycosyltransferase family 2 protein n=1 Tax=Sulfurimonas microaerophilic TaxID=3058392 RepID=UPI002714B851|nr:glycosyltransferase family 2 protein [Sulfurimonas sp. hsl 1-7]
MNVSIIIPVYNEKGRLEKVLDELQGFNEVIVIDDASSIKVESYIDKKKFPNLQILTNEVNKGYLHSIKAGIAFARNDIVVTMDGDGEHRPEDVTKLIQPILDNKCDIVFGKRPEIARESEIFLLWLARMLTGSKVKDSGTGFRAIKTEYAKKLQFYGGCTCGTLLQECDYLNMRICEVDVELPKISKPRKIAWDHFFQFFSIWKFFFKTHIKGLDE